MAAIRPVGAARPGVFIIYTYNFFHVADGRPAILANRIWTPQVGFSSKLCMYRYGKLSLLLVILLGVTSHMKNIGSSKVQTELKICKYALDNRGGE